MRPFHWSLVASDLLTEQRPMHRSLGYIVVGLVGFRLIRALIGGRHAGTGSGEAVLDLQFSTFGWPQAAVCLASETACAARHR